MKPIPLNFLTMYADLAQGFEYADEVGSITKRRIKGRDYVYLTSKDGAIRKQRSLGPADDPQVQEEANRISAAAERARNMRTSFDSKRKHEYRPPLFQWDGFLRLSRRQACSNAVSLWWAPPRIKPIRASSVRIYPPQPSTSDIDHLLSSSDRAITKRTSAVLRARTRPSSRVGILTTNYRKYSWRTTACE